MKLSLDLIAIAVCQSLRGGCLIPVLKTYWDAAAVRSSVNAILGPAHSIGMALQFTGYHDATKFLYGAFDGPHTTAISFGSLNDYDAALKALPADVRDDVLAHVRASDAARIKATNMVQANRLAPRDIVDLIADDLAQYCIAKPKR
jgi:hypothetical protein